MFVFLEFFLFCFCFLQFLPFEGMGRLSCAVKSVKQDSVKSTMVGKF